MPTFQRDGIEFHYRDSGGSGVPFFFQHGLGGDSAQPFSLCDPPAGFRLLCLDCRGHGPTRPLGDERKLAISTFADDVLALTDHLKLDRVVMGGISMGAALALNFTVRHPSRVRGLVLSRPAWLDKPMPDDLQGCRLIAKLIREHGAARAKQLYTQSEDYQQMSRQCAPAAEAMLGQFDNDRAEDAVARMERIPADSPIRNLADARAIAVPTLVIVNRPDPVHPYEYGVKLAGTIPGAVLREVTCKFLDGERHARDVKQALREFLTAHFA